MIEVNPTVKATPAFLEPVAIKEDSTLLKVVSCLPFVGGFVSSSQERSLGHKLEQTDNAPHLVELIKVKNHYKTANTVRNVIQIALAIAGIVAAVLFGAFTSIAAVGASALLIVSVFSIVRNEILMRHNKQMIKTMQTEGFKPGLLIF